MQWAKGVATLTANTAAVKAAIDAQLPFATGTDCPGNCAQVGTEAEWLYKMGLPPLDAIQAATAHGPLALGAGTRSFAKDDAGKGVRGFGEDGMAPKSGQLKIGYAGDMIGFADGNPLTNMTLLTDPDQITHIFKAGQVIKTPEYTTICENSHTSDPTLRLTNGWLPEAPEW